MAEANVGLKDRDLQAYYEALLALYAMPGWQCLVDDLQKIYETGNALEGVSTVEELYFRKGQMDIIKMIVAQPAVTRAAYDILLEDDNA